MAACGSDVFIGVDVGTNSVRALALDGNGTVLCSASELLHIHEPRADYYEQSSNQIWFMTCAAVKQLLATGQFKSEQVKAIGFDATCSLVVLNDEGAPLSVSPDLDAASPTSKYVWNVVMWMDHRAKAQADRINRTRHSALECVGKTISLEMQPPKLLWLKENKPQSWVMAGHFFDLADFMTYKATERTDRSLCCVVCKWLYQANPVGGFWDSSFWQQIGLGELCDHNFCKIGARVRTPGSRLEAGLSKAAAAEMGLQEGTVVAAGIIDAHAGAIGILATKVSNSELKMPPLPQCLAMICGTSTCHMALSESSISVPGIWGPYYDAVLPGLWLNEAGQSAVGPILDMVIRRFGSFGRLDDAGLVQCHDYLLDRLSQFVQTNGPLGLAALARDVHVWPDYHGNRSPLADPNMKGALVGLDLAAESSRERTLMTVYVAHVFSFAYMSRYILETLEQKGHHLNMIFMCGGLAKNWFYVQTHADVLSRPVVTAQCDQGVALGAAVLAANAYGTFGDMRNTMEAMGQNGQIVMPQKETQQFHQQKYDIFIELGQFVQKCFARNN